MKPALAIIAASIVIAVAIYYAMLIGAMLAHPNFVGPLSVVFSEWPDFGMITMYAVPVALVLWSALAIRAKRRAGQ